MKDSSPSLELLWSKGRESQRRLTSGRTQAKSGELQGRQGQGSNVYSPVESLVEDVGSLVAWWRSCPRRVCRIIEGRVSPG